MLAEQKRKQRINVDPQNLNWRNDTNAFGKRMLEQMGWQEGSGLGKTGEGINANVRPNANYTQKGLGFNGESSQSEWLSHNDEFSRLLAELNQKNANKSKQFDSDDLKNDVRMKLDQQRSVANGHRKRRLNTLSSEQKTAIFGKTPKSTENGYKTLRNFGGAEEVAKEGKTMIRMDSNSIKQRQNSSSIITMDVYFAKKMVCEIGQGNEVADPRRKVGTQTDDSWCQRGGH